MGISTARSIIVRDALERFPQLPARTIARYVLQQHGPDFDGDLEKVRDCIRYQTGRKGAKKPSQIVSRSAIKLPKTWRNIRTPYTLPPGLWLFLFDVHIPFHEPKPLEAAIKFGQQHKVDGIFLGGDAHDCQAVTFWPSAIRKNFDAEIEMMLDFLDFLENELPGTRKVWKPGNHEFRLPRYYQAKAPELIGLPMLAFDTVLGLESRGIEFLDYFQIVMAGKLPVLHGHEFRISRTVNPARGLFLKAKTWAMCGHCHSTSEHPAKDLKGTLLTTWSVGCLCDLSPDYNPFGNDWNWGFALVNVEKNGDFSVENRRILPNGKVV